MKNRILTSLILILTTIIFSFNLYSCQGTSNPISSEETCGIEATTHILFPGPAFNGYKPDTYTLGSLRYFNFWVDVDSICPDRHVKGEFFVSVKHSTADPNIIKFSSAVEWLLFYERTDTGSFEYFSSFAYWNSTIHNVGLKQAFGSSKASLFMNVYASFPTLGNVTLDSTYLANHVNDVSLKLIYSYYKPPANSASTLSSTFDFTLLDTITREKIITALPSPVRGKIISMIIPGAAFVNETIPVKANGIEGFDFKFF